MSIEIKNIFGEESFSIKPNVDGTAISEITIGKGSPLRKNPALREILGHVIEGADETMRIGLFDRRGRLTRQITPATLRNGQDFEEEIKRMKKEHRIGIRRGLTPPASDFIFD